jgi:hypothetical protein
MQELAIFVFEEFLVSLGTQVHGGSSAALAAHVFLKLFLLSFRCCV